MVELGFRGSFETDRTPFRMLDLVSSSAGSGSSVMSASSRFGPLLEFSGCSTETESSEDDDFVAGLAERMAHSMLEDSDDEDRKIDEFGTKSESSNWMNMWTSPRSAEIFQQLEGQWTPTQTISKPGSLVQSALSSECRSTPVLPSTVKSRRWNNGRAIKEMSTVGSHAGFGDHEHRSLGAVHPSMEHSWQFNLPSETFQLPRHQSFTDHSYFAQDHSSLPTFTSSRFHDRISESQKQGDLDERCKFFTTVPSKQGTLAPAWTKPCRNYPHQRSMGNSKMGHHLKGGFQNPSKIVPAAQARSIHSRAGGSGMRAVFLGGSGACKESSGTGVFLPLSANYPKRKPACSTVLLPSRIVQMLNLQLDNLGCQPLGSASHNAPLAPIQFTGTTPQTRRAPQNSKQVSSKGLSRYNDEHFKTISDCSEVLRPSIESVSRLPVDWNY